MDIKNSIIFVTGSADRVGKAIALMAAHKGAQLIIHYHTKKEQAEQTAEEIAEIGFPPLVVQGDISRPESWLQFADEILKHYGRMDVLVNNAAIFYKTPFLKITEEQWNHFMDVNLKGAFLGGKVFGEVMYKQKKGKIINIADVSAEKVWPGYIPYCVSKAGIIALTKGISRALAPYVAVNAIAPGTVLLAETYDAEQERQLIDKTPMKRIGSPQDIANTAAFLIEGSDFITGSVIKVDGGRSLV